MKISQKDAKLLIFLACILLLAASYFFGYKKYSDKTDAVNKETQVLKTEYETLNSSNIHREEYTQKIKANEENVKTIVAKYPSAILNQDEIYLSGMMEQSFGVWIDGFHFSEPVVVYNPQNLTEGSTKVKTEETKTTDDTKAKDDSSTSQSPAPSSATPQPAVPASTPAASKGSTGIVSLIKTLTGEVQPVEKLNFTGCKNVTRLNFKSDYNQMKKMIEYITTYGSGKSISIVNLAVDRSTGLLVGEVEYNSYSIVGAGATYKPLEIPSTTLGIKNIFGDIISNNKDDKKDKDQKNEDQNQNNER